MSRCLPVSTARAARIARLTRAVWYAREGQLTAAAAAALWLAYVRQAGGRP
jgi:hypothetical protein